MENKGKIKKRILVPICLVLLFLIGTGVFMVYQFAKRQLHDAIHREIVDSEKLLQLQIDEDAELLSSQIDFLVKDEHLRKSWLAKDREALNDYAAPLFENMRTNHRVTHFYFMGLDRVCFLRVHNSKRYGDKIGRFTMLQAEGEGKESYGIELGPFGTFTLRVVRPWMVNGQLIGYIELGEEITHLTPNVKEVLGNETYFIVSKQYLERDKWEEGLEMVGQEGLWDLFPNFVIIDHNMEDIPPHLFNYLKQLVAHEHGEHIAITIKASMGKRDFFGGFLALNDAGDRDIGDIVVLVDITKEKASLRITLILLIGIGIFVSVLLFVFLYFYIGRVEGDIILAQDRLIAGKEYTDNIITSMLDCLLVIDPDVKIRMVNKAACDLLGYSEAELIEKDVSSLFLEEKNFKGEKLQRLIKDGLMPNYETDLKAKDGRRIPVLLGGAVMKAKDNELSGVVVMAKDMTERKKFERERESFQQQLQRSQKLESIGTMANGMAHNLNNILGSIRGLVEIVLSDLPPDSQSNADLKTVVKGIEEAKDLSDKMLAFSRKRDRKCEKIKLHSVVKETVEFFKASMTYFVEIKQNISADCGAVCVDLNEIKQVVMNLCSNAYHSMENTGGVLGVSLDEVEIDDPMALRRPNLHKGKYARITVSDTGHGMDQGTVDRIFEPFFTTKAVGKGTGLGLSVIHGIVMNYHGEITVDSQPEKGTTVNVYLPLAGNDIKC